MSGERRFVVTEDGVFIILPGRPAQRIDPWEVIDSGEDKALSEALAYAMATYSVEDIFDEMSGEMS